MSIINKTNNFKLNMVTALCFVCHSLSESEGLQIDAGYKDVLVFQLISFLLKYSINTSL